MSLKENSRLFTWCMLIFVNLSLVQAAGQCKDSLPPPINGKLTFKPFDGNMKPSTLSTEYDSKGLQPFFNLAKSFMDTVQSKKLSEEFKGCKYIFSFIERCMGKFILYNISYRCFYKVFLFF